MSNTDSIKAHLGFRASIKQGNIVVLSNTRSKNTDSSHSIRFVQHVTAEKSNSRYVQVNFAAKSRQNAYRKINKKLGEG